MKQQISLREANQHLSRYIQAVERGGEVVITRRGTPVARLIGVTKNKKVTPEQKAALKSLFSANWKLGRYKFNREELYEERLERITRGTKGKC
ncbi:MAG: type II toxin-antitoxin system Phd/YefM family antitoxin [Burkholderiales bacterium]